ncbi:centrosomal protein 1 [Echinococcus multilocularis]|uniref:Centrosomal protein 1 n=1 Tax=Echinococcus multilocularis TaxID=6211 RepID=A0A068Y730_ECHMU|nr:centrosomal protein 1 [Echinococcus multilocularis]
MSSLSLAETNNVNAFSTVPRTLKKFPVQYINEDFLRRCTKTQDLSTVHHLCLTANVIAPYKIVYLEHLEGLKYLTVLNVSGNGIESLEGLRSLTRLKCLNLNHNCVSLLNGLENLKNLQRLYLNHNMVQDFPSWFQHSLVSLKSLQVGYNRIDNLHILTKLRRLPNLVELVIKGNPATHPGNAHHGYICPSKFSTTADQQESVFKQCCRSFVIFHLRSLTLLDGQIVVPEERKEADCWFEQSEISRINSQLESREAEVADLSDCLARLSIEAEGRGALAEGLARQKAEQDLRLEEMRKELAVKDELLRAKSDELLRACLKHYEIEQELAFYKIDTKLAAFLGKPPDVNAGGEGGYHRLDTQAVARSTSNVKVDESPYLGKCRYIRLSSTSTSNQASGVVAIDSHTLPPPKSQVNVPTDPRRTKSIDFSPFTSSLARSFPLQLSPHSDRSDEEATAATASSEDFSEASPQHQEQQQQLEEPQERGMPLTSTPLKMVSPHAPSTLKGRITASGTVTMPFFSTSPEPEELTEDSWYRGPPTNHNGSRSSVSNQKCNPRSIVRIQCDSGIEAGNHCSNDIQEGSLDDGRIESLPDSPHVEHTPSQRRDSSTQASISSQNHLRNPSRCQTDSPAVEMIHRQWQERTRQRLGKPPTQHSNESINVKMEVNGDDLKLMKKELVRLQAAVLGLSTERARPSSETGSDDAARQKTSDDVDFASTFSEPHNGQSRPVISAKRRTNKPPSFRQERFSHLACSWNPSDHTEGSITSEYEQTQHRENKTPTKRFHACIRGAASAVDIRRSLHRASTGYLKHRGKSMEMLPDNTPLDVQLLYKLQSELYDLHDRLQYAENANTSRLEEAIRHINVLESELRRSRGRRDSPEGRRWQIQLSEGLDEMRRCRDCILELQRKLMRDSPNQPRDQSNQNGDLEEVRGTLKAQERELSKLTGIVNRLTQTTPVCDNSAGEVTEMVRVVPSGKLLCNVTEHHNLEDYLQHLQGVADELRQQLQQKRAKLKEVRTSSLELQKLLKEREGELTRVTSELLASKEELLRANDKVKSMIAERSSQADQAEAQRAESQHLEEKIAELTSHLGALRVEIAAVEQQKENRKEELEAISRRVEEKSSHPQKRTSQAFTGFTTEASSVGDGNPRSDSSHFISPRYELDQLQPKVAEARARMETLSREIGIRTAELELLRSKKAQEAHLADVQLEATRRELRLKLDELSIAKEELYSVRQERDRMDSELQFPRQTASMHPTSDGIPTISGDVSELALRLQNLRADISRHKDEISKLEDQRRMKREEVSQLEKSLTEAKEELVLTQTRRQNAEAQLSLTRQKGELLKGQLEAFEASVEVKHRLISDLCSSSESRIVAMEKELQRMLSSTQQVASERSTAKMELTQLKQQLQAGSNELQNLEAQITSTHQRLEKSDSNTKVSRAGEKLRALNETIAAQTVESERLAREISEKQRLLKEMQVKLHFPRHNNGDIDAVVSRLEELESLLRQREHEIEVLIGDKTKLMEDHSQLVSELTTTRSQLEATQRACKKLKRRTAKELADLERVAEEQCNRASVFAEELALLRRNYTYLQARIAASEEVSDRERRLQEALFAIKTELAASSPTAGGIDAALRHFDAIESLVRRNLHSPLNGFSATHLKSFSSVPHLAMPQGGSAESVGEEQLHPLPPQPTSTKNVRPPSSGLGSSITPQSSSDDRLLNLQEQARRQLLEHQTNLEIERLKHQIGTTEGHQ